MGHSTRLHIHCIQILIFLQSLLFHTTLDLRGACSTICSSCSEIMQCCTMVSENTTFALGWQRNSNFHLMHFKIKTWEMCRWRTFLLPFLPAFWLQGNDLFLSKFSFEKEYISVRMEFATKRRKIYVEFPTVSFPAFCTFLFIGITLHPAFKSELLLGEDECFWDHR